MKEFSKKVLLNYISGNDVGKYDIDELENNPLFMSEVIKLTKDKNTLKLCGDDVFKDVNFIHTALETFESDANLCIELANDFVDNDDINFENRVEVAVFVSEKYSDLEIEFKKDVDTKLANINIFLGIVFSEFVEPVENKIINNPDAAHLQKGFIVILSTFDKSKLVKDYFAKRMLNDIFENDIEYNLDIYLREAHGTPNYALNMGIEQYVLNIVKGYDTNLADYLEFNKNLTRNIVKLTEARVKEWAEEYHDDISYKIENLISKYLYYPEAMDLGWQDFIDLVKNEFNIEIAFPVPDLDCYWSADEEYDDAFEQVIMDIEEEPKEYTTETERERLLLQFKREVASIISLYKTPQDDYIEAENKLRKKVVDFSSRRKSK